MWIKNLICKAWNLHESRLKDLAELLRCRRWGLEVVNLRRWCGSLDWDKVQCELVHQDIIWQKNASDPSLCLYLVVKHAQLFETPWTVAHQAPLSMGILQPKYWSGLPCPPPVDLPNPGIKLSFLCQTVQVDVQLPTDLESGWNIQSLSPSLWHVTNCF